MKTQLLFLILTFNAMNTIQTTLQDGKNWTKIKYEIYGKWSIQTNNGEQTIVFDDNFKTSSGPDVKVFLSPKQVEDIGPRDAVDVEGLYLGIIKEFSGKQAYAIPKETNLKDYKSVVLHCEAYSVVWGGANLRD
jgi:Electron transfer DM13.